MLRDPQRLLAQLLSDEVLEPSGEGQFRYLPRPLALPGGLTLAPQVELQTRWQDPQLQIQLIDYQLPGLATLERNAHYSFEATLVIEAGILLIQAQARLALVTGEKGLRLPRPLLAFLGTQTLALIFGRLERRCRRNLGRGPTVFRWSCCVHLHREANRDTPITPSHPFWCTWMG